MGLRKLDRHEVDRIAAAVVSGRRGFGRRVDRMADAVADLMENRLAAAGAPGTTRRSSRKGRRRIAQPPCDRQTLALVIERTAKHLAWLVHTRDVDDLTPAD